MAPKKSRRARRGDDDSDDELATQASVSPEATDAPPAQTQKKTSKKKQKKKNAKVGDWSDDDEIEAKVPDTGDNAKADSEDEAKPAPAKQQKGKKKGKAAKKTGFAALSALDPESDPEAEAEAEQIDESPSTSAPVNGNGIEEQDSPTAVTQATAGFAALDLDNADSEVEEVSDQKTASGFAALSVDDDREGEPIEEAVVVKTKEKGKKKGKSKKATFDVEAFTEAATPSIQSASVLSVAKHPNADKLKVCQISNGIETVQVVTNAATVVEGMRVVLAPVGSTTPGSNVKIEQTSLRGVDSSGMLCSAFDLGWEDMPDGVLVELPEDYEDGQPIGSTPVHGAKYGAQAAPPKAKKKGKKNLGFADLPEEPAAEEPVVEVKGKKSKKAFEIPEDTVSGAIDETSTSPAVNGHDSDQASLPATEKPKKKKKKAAFDPDAVLADVVEEETPNGAVTSESREPEGSEPVSQPSEKKKKGKKKAFDIDASLAEVGIDDEVKAEPANVAPTAPEPAVPEPAADVKDEGKKGKKKKGKGGDEGEEDLDALLAEFGVDTEAAEGSKKSKKKKKGKADAPAEQPAEQAETSQAGAAEPAAESSNLNADADGDAGEDEDGETEGKELTAAQKKKLKKKAKDKAKKAEGDDAGPKKAGGKKESAAVRKLREEMERQRAAQEAEERAEEERRRKEEEAARLAEEEAKRREEEKARRKEEKAKNRAELKRQGLLLTGKEKAEAERLAAMREQFLRNNPGAELPTPGESGPKKRPIYGKKKPSQKRPDSGDASKDAEAATKAAEDAAKEAEHQRMLREQEAEEKRKEAEAEAQKAAEAAAAAEEAAAAAEESDDMGWDDIDVDAIKLPGQEDEPEPEIIEAESEEEDSEEAEDEPAPEVPAKKAKTSQATATPQPAAPAGAAKPAAAENSEEESEEEEESSSDEESSSEEDSDSDDDSSEYTSSDESMDSEDARQERLLAARQARAKRLAEARQEGNAQDLRSPICCILGHVDTGKTKLLDNIRRTSVQEGEAGGITQQIGATYVPGDSIKTRTEPVRQGREFELKLPGLLIIDTPGHEAFNNLRSRGSSLCDIAILVVDIMHGLEPQTIASIDLLKQKKTPFIVALNKVDRLFEWASKPNAAIRESLDRQPEHVKKEFEDTLARSVLNLNEQGLNVALYWKNPDPRKYVNIVPTSAITGEGIPDMLQLVVQLTQKMMAERLMFISELQCTVLEVKVIEGLGTTIDVVLVNGVLHEGDQIVLCGLQGPIVTTIRSLLTPHPLKELRVRGSYLHHKEIKAAQGIKIAAQNLEQAVAGTQMLVVQKGDSIEDLKSEVMGDMTDIFSSVDKTGEGVCVQASTLGSLEALLEFLKSDAVKIPVSGISIGPVHRKDVMRAGTMLEKGRKKFAVILAFDVPVTREAQEQANNTGVRIFTADIIYHLFDQFSAYLKFTKEEEQQAAAAEAVFPVELKIMPNCIFNTKDPIVLGCTVVNGIAKVGTPLCVPSKGGIMLGKIASMEINHKPVEKAKKGDDIALKIEATNADESAKLYGRHFDLKDMLVSKISRRSIDLLKLHFKDQLERPDWQLVVKLKKVFGID